MPFQSPATPMPVVSITRLRVRSWRFLPVFMIQALRSVRQAASAQGNLVATVLRDRNKTFWTRTIWTTEAAMKSFMQSGAHGKVMRKLLEWCDEAALVRWTQDTSDIPTWQEAHRRLQAEGRRSKVNHPSAAHDAYIIAEPVEQKNRS
jgi:heme-degrading monooxygenase HmoA